MNAKKTSNKSEVYFNCPYGKSGDRLWVRETWQGPILDDDEYQESRRAGREKFLKPQYCVYRATDQLDAVDEDGNKLGWKPSIHMPRWASRILLEIINVRVERLQGICEEDAKAEGAYPIDFGFGDCYAMGFNEIWESINGIGSWDSNPFCWVIEFKVISK